MTPLQKFRMFVLSIVVDIVTPIFRLSLFFLYGRPEKLYGLKLYGEEHQRSAARAALERMRQSKPDLLKEFGAAEICFWLDARWDLVNQLGNIFGIGTGYQVWKIDGYLVVFVEVSLELSRMGKDLLRISKDWKRRERLKNLPTERFEALEGLNLPAELLEAYRVSK